MTHCRLQIREFRHRIFGANSLPDEVWIDSFEDAVAFIGKQREAARFLALLEVTRIGNVASLISPSLKSLSRFKDSNARGTRAE